MNSSVQFSSVQDGIYALGKVHMRSIPSFGSFPNVALETVPMLFLRLSPPGDRRCGVIGVVPNSTDSKIHFVQYCRNICSVKLPGMVEYGYQLSVVEKKSKRPINCFSETISGAENWLTCENMNKENKENKN